MLVYMLPARALQMVERFIFYSTDSCCIILFGLLVTLLVQYSIRSDINIIFLLCQLLEIRELLLLAGKSVM